LRDFKGLAAPDPVIFAPKTSLTAGVRRGKRPAFQINPSFAGSKSLVKADLGLKRVCPSCAARFYDLQKRPIECPKCQFSFEPEAMYKQRRPRQPEAVAVQAAPADAEDDDAENEDEENEEAEAEETVVEPIADEAPIQVAATGEDEEEEEAAEETETEGAGMSVVDEDDIEDIVVEDEEEDEEDNSLLEEDEDENDDVSGIIDADIEKDER
jgi:uncharacterized protein (TIGR02300 family)